MGDMYVMPADEFEEIEDAVNQTPRGRSFLRLYAKRHRAIAVEDMRTTVEAIRNMAALENEESARLSILRRELQEMGAAIVHCRQEIAAIKPEDSSNNRIMAATEELDAIVSSTERATTDILSAAEVIQDTSDKLAEGGASADLCDQIQNQAINIMTACSFQDLTGQRTTKVVNVLRYLEQRVNAMMGIWSTQQEDAQTRENSTGLPTELEDGRPDSHLLNGPQPEGQGVSQGDVDAMFEAPTGAAPETSAADPVADAAEDFPGPVPAVEQERIAEPVPGDESDGPAAEVAEPIADDSPNLIDIINDNDAAADDYIAAVAAVAGEAASAEPASVEDARDDVVLVDDIDPPAEATEDTTTPSDEGLAEESLATGESPLKQEEVAELLGS